MFKIYNGLFIIQIIFDKWNINSIYFILRIISEKFAKIHNWDSNVSGDHVFNESWNV